MEWFIIGRDMHILCNPSTNAPDSLQIDDSRGGQEVSIVNNVATGSYDFETMAFHPDAKHVECGNYIAFVDKYGRHRLYTIMTIEGEEELDVHCEDIGLDLINEDAEAWDLTGSPESIERTMSRILSDTGWTVGINEIPDRVRATKYEGLTDSQLARIGMVMNTFEAECDFEIVMDGSKVVKQVVNIYKTLGEDLTAQRFVDDINLKALNRNESIEDLCTCVRCYGKENTETGQRVTIADIVFDDGRYYSPKGHVRIYDREAHCKWSRFRAYNYEGQSEFLGYINGTFEYDTDSSQELFSRGLSNLKTRNEKKVAYEAKMYDLKADIGDTIQIASHRFAEPIYLSARVQSVKNHYAINGEDTGILANYQLLESKPSKSMSDMLEDLKKQIVSIKSTEVAYQVGGSGTTPPTGTWYTEPKEPDPGAYLWTRTITSYSDGSESIAYSVSRNGNTGAQGEKGAPGANGQPTYTWVKYATSAAGAGMSDDPTGKSYIGLAYNKTTQTESDVASDYTWSLMKGDKGDTGNTGAPGPAGKGIQSSVVTYQANASGTTVPTGSWTVTIPSVTANQYLWTRTIITFTDSTTSIAYSVGKMGATGNIGVTGATGPVGAPGAPGNGIKSTTISYQASTSGTVVPTGTWTTTIPSVTANQFLWTRTILTYTDNTAATSYSIGKMGANGAAGAKGDSGIIVSASAPASPTVGQLWQSAAGQSIKRWTGSVWVIHYIAVENIKADSLSALTANIGLLKGPFSKTMKLPTGSTVTVTGEITINNGLMSGAYKYVDSGSTLNGGFSVDPDGIRGQTAKVGTGAYSFEYGYEGIKIRNGALAADLDVDTLRSLAGGLDWKKIGEVSGGAFNNNISFDASKYKEIMLAVGPFDGNVNSAMSNRVLASTVIPISTLEKTRGYSDPNGYHQAYYSSTYWAGLNYVGTGKIGARASGGNVLATIFAR